MNYGLPTFVEIGGRQWNIRNKGDYRVVLDVISALNDEELTERQRAYAALYIFYEEIPDDKQAAMDEIISFIRLGESEDNRSSEKLLDWDQDFSLIAPPVNRVLGAEIRTIEYLHWYTFIGAYQEIGECTFNTFVGIRHKKNKHIKLDKTEQEIYRNNREKIDFKSDGLTPQEKDFIANLTRN